MSSLNNLFTSIDRAIAAGPHPACLSLNPALWFSDDPQDIDQAKQFCGGCPAVNECLEGALERGESGVWGGHLLRRGQVAKRITRPLRLSSTTVSSTTVSSASSPSS